MTDTAVTPDTLITTLWDERVAARWDGEREVYVAGKGEYDPTEVRSVVRLGATPAGSES